MNHFIDLHRLQKGKTVKDFATWVKKGGKGAPPVNLSQGLDTGVISGGVSMGFPYRLAPGRYILSCFWQDVDEGGKPHVFLGMYRGLKVC